MPNYCHCSAHVLLLKIVNFDCEKCLLVTLEPWPVTWVLHWPAYIHLVHFGLAEVWILVEKFLVEVRFFWHLRWLRSEAILYCGISVLEFILYQNAIQNLKYSETKIIFPTGIGVKHVKPFLDILPPCLSVLWQMLATAKTAAPYLLLWNDQSTKDVLKELSDMWLSQYVV